MAKTTKVTRVTRVTTGDEERGTAAAADPYGTPREPTAPTTPAAPPAPVDPTVPAPRPAPPKSGTPDAAGEPGSRVAPLGHAARPTRLPRAESGSRVPATPVLPVPTDDGRRGRRRPRRTRAPQAHRGNALHPGAWWIWALGLGTAASRTTNPLLLALLIGTAGYVVAARRTSAPWSRSYGAFVRLGMAVLGIRLAFAVLLGSPVPGSHVLVTLPEVPLPHWAQGIRIGGRVTAEGLVFALYDGLKLATLLICVGAANALANPARLLKSLPGALYEAGVAVVVALTFAPHLIADAQRLRAARRLRGRPDRGLRGLLQVALPVLEGALERSVALAAAMDARGYGRTAAVAPAVRRTTAVLTLGGLVGVCAGTYGLLTAEGDSYGLPLLLAGLAAALGGLWLGGRRSPRTRYRPDVWGARAWLVAGSGIAVAAGLIVCAAYDPVALRTGVVPLVAPALPLWPAAAVLLGLLPAFVAPVPGQPRPARNRPPGNRPAAREPAATEEPS